MGGRGTIVNSRGIVSLTALPVFQKEKGRIPLPGRGACPKKEGKRERFLELYGKRALLHVKIQASKGEKRKRTCTFMRSEEKKRGRQAIFCPSGGEEGIVILCAVNGKSALRAHGWVKRREGGGWPRIGLHKKRGKRRGNDYQSAYSGKKKGHVLGRAGRSWRRNSSSGRRKERGQEISKQGRKPIFEEKRASHPAD